MRVASRDKSGGRGPSDDLQFVENYFEVVTVLGAGEAARCSARRSCSTCWVQSAISSSIDLISREIDVPRFEHWGFSGCVETRLDGEAHSQEWLCHQQQKRTQRFFAGGRRKAGRTEVRSYTGKKLGAEEDGFALEHFDGEEKRDGGVEAGGGEDHPDVIPVVSAGDEFLAEKADI